MKHKLELIYFKMRALAEAPRLLFPFARAIVSEATRDGGFMPLNIQPVDFVAVYQHNLAQQASTHPRN